MAEAAELRRQNEQWRELAMRHSPPVPQPNYQPAPERAFSYQDQTPQYPPSSLMMENPQEYDRQMQAYIAYTNRQSVQQAASAIMPQMAEAGRFMSQNDPEYRDVWGRYSAEIEQEMVRNNVPPEMRNKQAWDLVAGIVRGRHYRDLADELANQRLQSGGFGTESATNTGNTPPAAADGLSAFWASDHPWVQRAKAAQMSITDIRKHIANQGISEGKWVEDMTKGNSFSAEAA